LLGGGGHAGEQRCSQDERLQTHIGFPLRKTKCCGKLALESTSAWPISWLLTTGDCHGAIGH
jgi:hypothetical protein